MGISNDNIHNPHTSNTGATQGQRGPPGVGFKLTSDGNYDVDNKKLTNVATPTTNADAATKKYIDDHIVNVHQTGYLKKDGSEEMTGDLNVGGHKIRNVAAPTTQTGVTTKKYVDDGLNSKVANSQVMTNDAEAGKLVKYLPDKGIITPKLYIPDQFNDSVILEAEEQDVDDIHLKIPNLKNYDGNGGRRKSSVVVSSVDNTLTGKIILPSGNLVVKDGNDQAILNRADINKIFGSASGQSGIINNKVALYSSSGTLFSNTFAVKNENDNDFVILRCRNSSGWRSLFIPSLNSNADIIINQTNQTINGDKTFSRAITMTQEGSANNHLVTKSYVDLNLKKSGGAMSGPVTMSGNDLIGLPDNPKYGYSAVNRNYVTSNFLKLDGTVAMTGNLNMNQHKIVNLKNITSSSSNSEAVNKKYVDDEIAKIPSGSGGNIDTSNFLKKDGSVAMTGDLNMNEQRVKNTLDPSDEQDTVNKRYLESQLNDYLKRNGQNTMTFDLNMNRYKIVNLKDINNFSIDSEATNKKYVDDEIAKIPIISTSDFLKKDGSVGMTGDLNVNNHKIINVKDITSSSIDSDATNKKYVDTEIKKSTKKSSHKQENAFKYLMSDINQTSTEYGMVVDGYVNYEQSFHDNKKVISFKANLDGSNYRYRIGFELGLIQVNNDYTIAIEQLFRNQNYWKASQITISGTG